MNLDVDFNTRNFSYHLLTESDGVNNSKSTQIAKEKNPKETNLNTQIKISSENKKIYQNEENLYKNSKTNKENKHKLEDNKFMDKNLICGLLRQKRVLLTVMTYSIWSLCSILVNEVSCKHIFIYTYDNNISPLIPLWSITKIVDGGLSFNETYVGIV